MAIQDDAESWYETLGQQIQDFEAPEAPPVEPVAEPVIEPSPNDQRPYADLPEVTNDDVRNLTNLRAVSRPTAEVIVGTMDVVIPLLITLLIKHSERDDCKLTKDEHETLVEAWANYLGDKNVQMSPGMSLLMAIATIYGAKVVVAMTSAKERKVVEQQRDEIDRMRQEAMQRQNEIEHLKQVIAEQNKKREKEDPDGTKTA